MLTVEENERLSKVGPGSPMGELLRRFWQPIATLADIERERVMKVRRLGEDLVLYKSRRDEYGLIQERCPHRSRLAGLRHPARGRPALPVPRLAVQRRRHLPGAALRRHRRRGRARSRTRSAIDAYPVEALGGLVFAYMGPPERKPLLPRWAGFVTEGVNRSIGVTDLPCNWLQCMENSLDPVHFEWLHANLINFVAEKRGEEPLMFPAKHVKVACDEFEYGIYKRRLLRGRRPRDLAGLADRPPDHLPEHARL